MSLAIGGNCAVENVFKVEPSVTGNEQVFAARFVSEFGEAAVAGAVERQDRVIDSGVINYHGFYVAALEDDVGFGRARVFDVGAGESGDTELMGDECAGDQESAEHLHNECTMCSELHIGCAN